MDNVPNGKEKNDKHISNAVTWTGSVYQLSIKCQLPLTYGLIISHIQTHNERIILKGCMSLTGVLWMISEQLMCSMNRGMKTGQRDGDRLVLAYPSPFKALQPKKGNMVSWWKLIDDKLLLTNLPRSAPHKPVFRENLPKAPTSLCGFRRSSVPNLKPPAHVS